LRENHPKKFKKLSSVALKENTGEEQEKNKNDTPISKNVISVYILTN